MSVCGEVEVRESVRVCCVVWVLSIVLFSVCVEVCLGSLGVLLSCLVGCRMLVGLTWVVFVVLETRDVVTGGAV